MRRGLIRRGWRWLYITHRWIGIASCLLFAMWFVSGIVMMYVAFPQFSDRERWAALPSIAWEKVQIAPDRAMAIAGLTSYPRELRLTMMNGTPVYRLLGWDGARKTVSAVDGQIIDQVTPGDALAVAVYHPNATRPRMIDTIDRDQWSVTARFDPLRPLFQIALGDTAGTELYVSSRTGEIVLDTTRTERIWNWLGSVPHWIYPTVLRKDGATWRQVVLWISAVCIVVAVTGFWIGILRLRLLRRYASGAATPYRGWMAWHHVVGLLGGTFVLTWIFSGWLSLNPGDYFAGPGIPRDMMVRYGGQDAPKIVAEFSSKPQSAIVEARFTRLDGRPLMVLIDHDGNESTADPATGALVVVSDDQIFTAARRLLPDATMILRERLEQSDAYWYSHHQERPVPVLRVGFDDPERTWFHIDPRTGDILGHTDNSRRSYRWLFNALHSFDLPLLLRYRPAWDAVVWLLSLLGMIVSASGIVIGWRRLAR
ncbi:MAG TPA: PepSY domain-containing protein [Bradyrhizobium sp.]|nr:PepSY domain-containing protein [Bradyrhizobium sp.]